ncbi:hypothetical protein PRIPAC_74586 [Pristionchus pacificus]|uniref:Uncharacterized protein n=1 Tax=Pristionchus pacificus TaxID=54126 RepID=A0A454XRW4_PRIPA|nr:hypothetical protein PRIPAC_74586 [Pristionchus pacificus]|eukprot:PDM81245.1 hypothetical protein PRIPAC_36248 [Pristionchus pacificus]
MFIAILFYLLLILNVLSSHPIDGPLSLLDTTWHDQFEPVIYRRKPAKKEGSEEDLTASNNHGFDEQGMKDLDEVGSLVGGVRSDVNSLLRPYYSMVEMGAGGNKQGMGSYMHILPDSSEGDTPLYTLGGSFYGGLEPAGVKTGYMTRPFG